MLSSRSVTLGYMSYVRGIRNVCWLIGRSEDDLHSPGHAGRAVMQRAAGRCASKAGSPAFQKTSEREGGQEGEREGVKKEGGVKEGKTHRGEGRKKGRMGEREGGKTRVT